MAINKNKIEKLFNLEDFSGLKEEFEKSNVENKENLLNVLSTVVATDQDLTSYNGLIQKYGELEIAHKIMQARCKQLSILRKEIENL